MKTGKQTGIDAEREDLFIYWLIDLAAFEYVSGC